MPRNYSEPQTFASLDAFLGGNYRRRMANNTVARRGVNGSIYIRHYSTNILEYPNDGDYVIINCAGFRSPSTKARLNRYLNPALRIHQKDYKWYITSPHGTFPYKDGMIAGTRF